MLVASRSSLAAIPFANPFPGSCPLAVHSKFAPCVIRGEICCRPMHAGISQSYSGNFFHRSRVRQGYVEWDVSTRDRSMLVDRRRD